MKNDKYKCKITPIHQPELTFCDVLLIKTCLNIVNQSDILIPELGNRLPVIIEALEKAIKKIRSDDVI
jgi:hypothetical protein